MSAVIRSRSRRMEDDSQPPKREMMDSDDFKIQKREILEYVKGITNDLIQGNNLQVPDKLSDKVFHAAFLNLRNYLIDIISEWKGLKKRHKDFQIKVENLTKTVNTCQDQFFVANETIEKLRDDIDLKESNERILQHQLQMCKDSYKETESKHIANLKEYDDLTNDMKSQIELLEQKNNQLSGTVEHLQEKIKRERNDLEREKEALQYAQATYNKNVKNFEKKKTKLKLEKSDLEKANEQLHEAQKAYQKDMADFENKLSRLQQDRSDLDKEHLAFEKQKSNFNIEISNLQQERFNFGKERSDLELEKNDLHGEKLGVEREREELYQARMTCQMEMEDIGKLHAKLSHEKSELTKALTKISREKNEVKKNRERLQYEEQSCKESIDDFHAKLVQLTEHVCQEKTKEEESINDKLTNQLLESLSKVETLQNNLETKMKELETSNTARSMHSQPITVIQPTLDSLSASQNPVNQAMPFISTIPIYANAVPQNTSQCMYTNNVPANNLDQSINPAKLGFNDLSTNSRHVTFQPVNDGSDQIHHIHHVGKVIDDNSQATRDTSLQRKLERLEECHNVKWDLCRLEAKIADAVLKRSLYNNMKL